ncbi:MAG TPA: hypothetical protein VIK26_06500 [Clostridium sp.]
MCSSDDSCHESHARFKSAYIIEKNDRQFLIARGKIENGGDTMYTIVATDFTQEPYLVRAERRLRRLNELSYDNKSKFEFSDSFVKKVGGNPDEPLIKAKLLLEGLDFDRAAIVSTCRYGGFYYGVVFRFLMKDQHKIDYSKFCVDGGYTADLIDVMSKYIIDNIDIFST